MRPAEADSETSVAIRDFCPLPEDGRQYSPAFIRRHRVLLLKLSARSALVGTTRQPTGELCSLLQSYHGRRVEFLRVSDSDLAAHLARAVLGSHRPAPPAEEQTDRRALDRLANDAPVVDFVNGLLADAATLDASDIHIESLHRGARVRYRIDGRLLTTEHFAAQLFPAVSSRVKLMAGLNIMERRSPQDGRMSIVLSGKSRQARVSTVPSSAGESVVIRLLPVEETDLDLPSLGFRAREVTALERVARRPSGLILATGPTGCGKSTTLAALLHLLPDEDIKIVSIEDPVERRLQGVVQIQTNEANGLTFDRLLRHVLRQDPNVVMVGEIRDTATCALVVRAGLTGHLILSTLHTNSAASSVSRLRNLGAPSYLISEILLASIAQRLVRRLCPSCKRPVDPAPRVADLFRSYGVSHPTLFVPVGCDLCRGTGYLGRVPIVELLMVDNNLREAIAANAPTSALSDLRSSAKFQTMREDAVEKAAAGITSLNEILAVGDYPCLQ